jgi:hypothetical protein
VMAGEPKVADRTGFAQGKSGNASGGLFPD